VAEIGQLGFSYLLVCCRVCKGEWRPGSTHRIARRHWLVSRMYLLTYAINLKCFLCLNFYKELKVDCILLAGYLIYVLVELVQAYQRSILNIHPSLLPAFRFKVYYGLKTHKAVIASFFLTHFFFSFEHQQLVHLEQGTLQSVNAHYYFKVK
jgi:hypothetical protein